MEDKEMIMKHIKEDISYPATADDLKKACDEMSDLSDKDREWFKNNLPEGTYNSPEEVMSAMGIEEEKKEEGEKEMGEEEEM